TAHRPPPTARRLASPNRYAAVRRREANWSAARAELGRDASSDRALHANGKADVQAAVLRGRVKLCGVIRRHRNVHAAVRRDELEATTAPAVTAQVNGDSAVDCRAADVAVDVGEGDAAIHRFELHLRLYAVH